MLAALTCIAYFRPVVSEVARAPLGDSSLWRPVYGAHPSCSSPPFSREQDVALRLPDDATSLLVDYSALRAPACLHYVSRST